MRKEPSRAFISSAVGCELDSQRGANQPKEAKGGDDPPGRPRTSPVSGPHPTDLCSARLLTPPLFKAYLSVSNLTIATRLCARSCTRISVSHASEARGQKVEPDLRAGFATLWFNRGQLRVRGHRAPPLLHDGLGRGYFSIKAGHLQFPYSS